MKKTPFLLLAVATASLSILSCQSNTERATLNSQRDTLSWAMGMSLAETTKSNFYDFDEEVVLKAFKSFLAGREQPISQQEYEDACAYIGFLAAAESRRQDQQQSTDNAKRQEEAFAKLLAQKPDLKQAPQGFYYEVLREGKGPKATEGKRIEFDFKGINMFTGEVIEQTYGKRGSVVHVLGKPMFEGIFEGLQLMNAGSQFRFYFPFEKVVGARGIPPYTPVIYEVELHNIYND
jgi:FKBP-type peptidyl-prolyl cis-trans isomerase